MPGYVAFLRAINSTNRYVKMSDLAAVFTGLGFVQVRTFIQSGNVIFQAGETDQPVLESQVEGALRQRFGFEVATFLRTWEAVAAIADCRPFDPAVVAEAQADNIIFLRQPPTPTQLARLDELRSDLDEFASVGAEIYWLCRARQSQSKFSNSVLERRLGVESTIRMRTTLERLAELLSASRSGLTG